MAGSYNVQQVHTLWNETSTFIMSMSLVTLGSTSPNTNLPTCEQSFKRFVSSYERKILASAVVLRQGKRKNHHMKSNSFPTKKFTTPKRTVVVEWLAHQLHIRKVPGSNPEPESGYPEKKNFIWLFIAFTTDRNRSYINPRHSHNLYSVPQQVVHGSPAWSWDHVE